MSFLASISLSLSFHRMISSTANRHSASKRGTILSSLSLSFVFVFVPLPPFLSVSTHFPPCEQSLEWRGQILGLGPRSPHPALSFSSCNPPQEQLPMAVVAGAGSLFPWSSCPPLSPASRCLVLLSSAGGCWPCWSSSSPSPWSSGPHPVVMFIIIIIISPLSLVVPLLCPSPLMITKSV